MPLDGDGDGGVLLQPGGLAVEGQAGVVVEGRAVVGEEDAVADIDLEVLLGPRGGAAEHVVASAEAVTAEVGGRTELAIAESAAARGGRPQLVLGCRCAGGEQQKQGRQDDGETRLHVLASFAKQRG